MENASLLWAQLGSRGDWGRDPVNRRDPTNRSFRACPSALPLPTQSPCGRGPGSSGVCRPPSSQLQCCPRPLQFQDPLDPRGSTQGAGRSHSLVLRRGALWREPSPSLRVSALSWGQQRWARGAYTGWALSSRRPRPSRTHSCAQVGAGVCAARCPVTRRPSEPPERKDGLSQQLESPCRAGSPGRQGL